MGSSWKEGLDWIMIFLTFLDLRRANSTFSIWRGVEATNTKIKTERLLWPFLTKFQTLRCKTFHLIRSIGNCSSYYFLNSNIIPEWSIRMLIWKRGQCLSRILVFQFQKSNWKSWKFEIHNDISAYHPRPFSNKL